MDRSCPAQRGPQWLCMGGEAPAQSRAALVFHQAECPGAGGRRRNSSATAKLPHCTQHPGGPRLICPSAARARGGGRRERMRKQGSHACLPPSQSLFSSSTSSLPGCLGGRAAAASEETVPSLSARRDIPSSLRGGDAARFHRATPRPSPWHSEEGRWPVLAHCPCCSCQSGAELAAMHRQPHSSALPATYIGASRQERLLSRSEQHGPAYFLEAFQAASLQAALCPPLAPR